MYLVNSKFFHLYEKWIFVDPHTLYCRCTNVIHNDICSGCRGKSVQRSLSTYKSISLHITFVFLHIAKVFPLHITFVFSALNEKEALGDSCIILKVHKCIHCKSILF